MSFFKATQMRERKLGNKPGTCGLQHKHDSKLEIAVCEVLQWREKAGEIEIRKSQARVYLSPARYCCIPDFECFDLKLQSSFWVEAKGFEVPRWRDTKKLWRTFGPGPLEIWKGDYKRPRLVETIRPQQQLPLVNA